MRNVDRPRRGRFAAAVGGMVAAAALGAVGESAAQSPFQGTTAQGGGSFTIPTAPNARSAFTIERPQTPPTSPEIRNPSRGGGLAPLPGGRLGPLQGGTSRFPEELGPEGLPTPLSEEEVGEIRPTELPPKPRVAPELSAAKTAPTGPEEPVVLKAGMNVTLRVCRLLPIDGYAPGERLLNSRAAIQEGDRFLAEVLEPAPPHPVFVGGVVTEIKPPSRFGRPGYVAMQMTQIVQAGGEGGGVAPWRLDMKDRRLATRMRRAMLTALLGLEGAGTGASIGAQMLGGNMTFVGGGMGIGAAVGLAYATLQRGVEARLEPGDTFEIVVGTASIKPVTREWETVLYPSADVKVEKNK